MRLFVLPQQKELWRCGSATIGTKLFCTLDRGCQFTSDEYQRFLNGHNLVCSMSAVGSCADNALVEGFFGMLERESINRRRYFTRADARADIFNYIERFYNPRMRRKLQRIENGEINLNSTVRESGT